MTRIAVCNQREKHKIMDDLFGSNESFPILISLIRFQSQLVIVYSEQNSTNIGLYPNEPLWIIMISSVNNNSKFGELVDISLKKYFVTCTISCMFLIIWLSK